MLALLGILLGLTPSYRPSYAQVNKKSANWRQKMPIFSGFFYQQSRA
jgi:hypothetical protein